MSTNLSFDSNIILKAYHYARQAHEAINQRRKYTHEPYIVHPMNVVNILLNISHIHRTELNTDMLAAAYLHDTVEDTNITIENITSMFGEDITNLVRDLTDVSKPEDGNRKVRKLIDLEHTANASKQAKIIKLADLIDNALSIRKFDSKFYKVYKQEAKNLLEVIQDSNEFLANNLYNILRIS